MNASSPKIILIEDNEFEAEMSLSVLNTIFDQQKLLWIQDSEEAIAFLNPTDKPHNTQHLELVILDLKMPKIDGFEVLETLKENPTTKAIPVIILTASTVPKDIEKAYLAGANSFIFKPIDFDLFSKNLTNAIKYFTPKTKEQI